MPNYTITLLFHIIDRVIHFLLLNLPQHRKEIYVLKDFTLELQKRKGH